MAPKPIAKPNTDNAPISNTTAPPTKHNRGTAELLDVSINLYAGEEKEYFMSSSAFFTRINSEKIWSGVLLCIWPLVDTVKCQVSMHRFCSGALEPFWNTEKFSMFLLPALVLVHLLTQQAFSRKYTTRCICVADVNPLLHGEIIAVFTTGATLSGSLEGFSD